MVPRLSRHLNGMGAAMLAQEEKAELDFAKLMDYLDSNRDSSDQQHRVQLQGLTIAPRVDT